MIFRNTLERQKVRPPLALDVDLAELPARCTESDMENVSIKWDRGHLTVQPLGGMVNVAFILEDGREVSPLVVAPWGDDESAEHDALPELMKRLRGEWPCVPFGAPEASKGLPKAWKPTVLHPVGEDFHGFSAHNPWHVIGCEDAALTLAIDYPKGHPISRLERRIAGVSGAAAIELTLTIHTRAQVSVPIALHPVFRLPDIPGGAELITGPFEIGRTFPLEVEPDVSCLIPDTVFSSLAKVPATPLPLALDRLPLDFDTEELVQLCGTRGRVTLVNHADNYQSSLAYDPEVFPSTLLWISNRGRTVYPWNGRFLGLGIEPVRSAFDLGADVGCNSNNPIARAGFATALDLDANTSFTTCYRISSTTLAGSL